MVYEWLLPGAARASGLILREAVRPLTEDQRAAIVAASGRAPAGREGDPVLPEERDGQLGSALLRSTAPARSSASRKPRRWYRRRATLSFMVTSHSSSAPDAAAARATSSRSADPIPRRRWAPATATAATSTRRPDIA